MSVHFHPYLCGREATEWLINMIDYISKEPITKGWSGDKKYCVTTADGIKYLLRISPPEQYDKKKNEFHMMRRVANDFTPCDGCEKATSGRLQAYS